MSIPLILLLLTLVAYLASLWKLFQKAGEPTWAGFVPGYNFFVWQKITERPWWWILILIIPGVQFLMLIIMNVQMARSFGQRGTVNTILAAAAPFYLFPKMAFSEEIKYTGNIDWKKEPKNLAHDWGDALLFALIAAFIIRSFVMEAFTIPTPSMERSMLVGDYLFVSKARYGAKLPETPISFPLAHHTIPILNIPSFVEWQKLDYHRLPGWADLERGDPVVFNFPEGDTVLVANEAYTYYQYLNDKGFRLAGSAKKFEENKEQYIEIARKAAIAGKAEVVVDDGHGRAVIGRSPITIRPKDKKENYVKRAVGVAGDELEIRDRQLYINGEAQTQYEHLQFNYYLTTKGKVPLAERSFKTFKEDLGLNYDNFRRGRIDPYVVALTNEQLEGIKQYSFIESVVPLLDSVASDPLPASGSYRAVFPQSPDFPWTRDNFGPIKIPAKGQSLPITVQNLPLFERIIRAYEGNELYIKDGQVFINGVQANEYTFKMDYYWMMGDNRHNSLDSRYWGFVPEDHIVGRPSFVWLSLDKELGWFDGKVRWSRMFRGVE